MFLYKLNWNCLGIKSGEVLYHGPSLAETATTKFRGMDIWPLLEHPYSIMEYLGLSLDSAPDSSFQLMQTDSGRQQVTAQVVQLLLPM